MIKDTFTSIDFDKKISTFRSIYYWIRRTITNVKWGIYRFFFPAQKWVKKGIIYNQYCDKVELIKDFNFAALVHYVDGDGGLHYIDWTTSQEMKDVKSFIVKCYNYVKRQRPKLMLLNTKWLMDPSFFNNNELFCRYQRLEEYTRKKDLYYLQGIATYYEYLWV